MRAGDPRSVAAPPRLSDGDGLMAQALREARQHALPSDAEESAAWRRLSARRRPPGGQTWRWAGVALAAAAAVVILARPQRRPVPITAPVPRTEQPAGPPVATAVAVPRPRPPSARRVALAPRPVSLPVGEVRLADEATIEVAPQTTARASADAAWVRVVVDRGEVALHVEKRAAGGPGFEVAAGRYQFRVLGTKFRVARHERDQAAATPSVELWVEEGRVAISQGRRTLAVVGAGGHWAAERPHATPRPAPAVVPAQPPEVAPPAPAAEAAPAERARCAALAAAAAGAREAVTCYLAQAQGDGVAAQTALYEAGRLRRDELGDDAGALEAFRAYRARFPRGMLRAEVDLSIVELLPKVNRHREALEEIGRLLADGGGRERAAELLLVRANIYREVLEDYARAERDYAAVEAHHAPAVGDATFFRGVCLQALGRTEPARAAFERYLSAGAPRFADEARRRMQRLSH